MMAPNMRFDLWPMNLGSRVPAVSADKALSRPFDHD